MPADLEVRGALVLRRPLIERSRGDAQERGGRHAVPKRLKPNRLHLFTGGVVSHELILPALSAIIQLMGTNKGQVAWLGFRPDMEGNGRSLVCLRWDRRPDWDITVVIDADGAFAGIHVDAASPAPTTPKPPRTTPRGGLSYRLVQDLPFAELERVARQHEQRRREIHVADVASEVTFTTTSGELSGPLFEGGGEGGELHGAALEQLNAIRRRRPNRAGRGPTISPEQRRARALKIAAHLATLADHPSPLRALRDSGEYGSYGQVRNLVFEARNTYGFLEPTSKGKFTARLTQLAKDELRSQP